MMNWEDGVGVAQKKKRSGEKVHEDGKDKEARCGYFHKKKEKRDLVFFLKRIL